MVVDLRSSADDRSDDGYSLCLLGTSNGVIKNGYSSYFSSSSNVKCFDNFSIGACTSSFVFYNLAKINMANYDFCILDLCVNDGLWMKAKHVDPQHWIDILAEVCCRILSSGCVPVILVLPTPDLISDSGKITALLRELCMELRIPYFDCYELMEKLKSDRDSSHGELLRLFKDSVHVRDDFGVELSRLIDGCLANYKKNLGVGDSFVFKTLVRHHVLHLGSQFGDDVCVRRTSRAGEVFSHVSQSHGDFEISVPRGAEIISVCIDLKASCGFLKIIGDNECEYKLSSSYYNEDWSSTGAGVILAFRPLKNTVVSSSGKVCVRVTANSGEVDSSKVCQALISSVIIRSDRYKIGVPFLFGGDIDMVKSLGMVEIQGLLPLMGRANVDGAFKVVEA